MSGFSYGNKIIGISQVTGEFVTLAEAVSAAKCRVTADRILGVETPEYIIRLSEMEYE